MPDETRLTCRYRTLRYMPNLLRDEWVNVGILLEQIESEGRSQRRRAVRLIEENSEYARVRRIHPALDEEMLRSLRVEFDKKLLASEADAAAYLAKLDQTLSNVLQFGPERAVFTDDFDIELDRLYREQVAPPVRRRQGILQSGVEWIRTRLVDVFRRSIAIPTHSTSPPTGVSTGPCSHRFQTLISSRVSPSLWRHSPRSPRTSRPPTRCLAPLHGTQASRRSRS